jgi:hypothetical protein
MGAEVEKTQCKSLLVATARNSWSAAAKYSVPSGPSAAEALIGFAGGTALTWKLHRPTPFGHTPKKSPFWEPRYTLPSVNRVGEVLMESEPASKRGQWLGCFVAVAVRAYTPPSPPPRKIASPPSRTAANGVPEICFAIEKANPGFCVPAAQVSFKSVQSA